MFVVYVDGMVFGNKYVLAPMGVDAAGWRFWSPATERNPGTKARAGHRLEGLDANMCGFRTEPSASGHHTAHADRALPPTRASDARRKGRSGRAR